jgi:transcriptional regulator with XRE-family HTH domain
MDGIHPLRAYRQNQDPPLKQKQLADILGVKKATVSRWETGARKVDEELLPVVSERTGIPKAELRPDLADLIREVVQ